MRYGNRRIRRRIGNFWCGAIACVISVLFLMTERAGAKEETFPMTKSVSMEVDPEIAQVEPSGESASRPGIRRSDRVFMYDVPDRYEEYRINAVGWAGSPSNVVRGHEHGIRMFACSVGFRTEFAEMMNWCERKYGSGSFRDSVCRDIEGQPFIVPWLWDHKRGEERAWHFCTNAPRYREFLVDRAVQTADSGADALHIDDYTGTAGPTSWGTGCFCEHCMKLYREDLQIRYAQMESELTESGLSQESLKTFDYGEFLRNRGLTTENYRERYRHEPLMNDYIDFQYRVATEFVGEYHRMTEERAGRPLALAVNSGMWSPLDLVIAPIVTYFCGEVGHSAHQLEVPTHPLSVYRLADALNRPMTSTATGQDWAFIAQTHREPLVRSWIVISYISGHNFMAPQRQWCYTEEKGTHWYDAPEGAYSDLYRFVAENAEYLDSSERVATVAVIFDMAARLRGMADIEPTVTALTNENVAMDVIVAGNAWIPQRITTELTSKYDMILADPDWRNSPMDPAQKSVLEQCDREGKLYIWTPENLRTCYESDKNTIRVADRNGVPISHYGATMRVFRNDSSAAVVHLYSRSYDPDKNDYPVYENITVKIPSDLLPDRPWSHVTLRSPDHPPVDVELKRTPTDYQLRIPTMKLWTMAVFSVSETP
ncbi:MAG: hypothetical protein Q4C47_01160 [Planctomycetia bacterium]|nr:hypothetical protein [Planctomycetia bacterium]